MRAKGGKKGSGGLALAWREGGWPTRLSLLVWGAGHMVRGQRLKGALLLAAEGLFWWFFVAAGLPALVQLPGLGDSAQEKVWNEAKQIFEYTRGDSSLLILLYGISVLFVCLAAILLCLGQFRHSYKLKADMDQGRKPPSLWQDILSLRDGNIHALLMSGPLAGILLFTVLPIVFMISMAFTDYSKEGDKLLLFDWVGLVNFQRVLNWSGTLGRQFWSVLAWTVTWAFLATFLNYFLGMALAMVINRRDTKWKAFWRFCFVLSIAVPQFVSLLIMRTMLQPQGAVNVILQNLGIIDTALPFWTDPLWARVTVIVVNLWVGIPFTLMQVTGILQNIPTELYEAARVDGANHVTIFFKITLPYMLFVTAPYLITQFTGNINNFNVIYLLSAGGPTNVGDTAGQTDLLVTWLFKLTIEQQYFNIGAVIGILTFVILAIVSLVTYRNSGAYKNEEAFM